jgi:hypothetical protein
VIVSALFAGSMLIAAAGASGATARPPASKISSTAEPALCASITRLDRLIVSRNDAFPKNGFRFSFPRIVTVKDAAAVRAVAGALCALPKMPRGALHCPADWGITYQLVFSAKGRTFSPVRVAATGCQEVTGLGQTRWVARSRGFWKTLGQAMGLPHPDNQVFAGSRTQG